MAFLKDLIVLGTSRFIGDVQGSKFIVDGATSSLFLKGDGTLDPNTYLTLNDKVIIDKGGTGNNSNTSVIDGGIVNEDLVITNSGHDSAININPGGVTIIPNWAGFSNYPSNSGTSNVSIDTGAGKLYYNSNEVITTATLPTNYVVDYSKQYLTFVALEDGTISFNIWKNMGTDMITSISYSIDNGETWTTTNNTNSKTEHLSININVNEGDKILWKGDAQQMGYYDEYDYGDHIGSFFSSTCEFDVEGNVMSLLYGDNFKGENTLEYAGQFACLFSDYDGEKNCKVVNAKNLSLPAITLADNCYQNMFCNCTSLITAPNLPATTLADYCYAAMFSCCASLTTAPKLPATILANYCYLLMFEGCASLITAPKLLATILAIGCYAQMFKDCINLTTSPELTATTLAASCYQEMFTGCTSLTTTPELPATTLAYACYKQMFYGCSSLTTAPKLPSTTLAESCYQQIFQNCTSLITAPELPATTLAEHCYQSMFQGCTSLNYIKAMFTTTPSSSYTGNWVYRVATTGTFIKNSNATWDVTGNYGIPTDWTVYTDDEYEVARHYEIPTTYAASATAAGPADKAISIPFAEVDATSTGSAFTATVSDITELRDGVCVYLRNGVEDSVSGCTLNINSLGAKPIHSSSTGNPITSAFTVAYTYLFVYNSTRVEGGCWDLYAGYENPNASNTSAYIVRTNSLRMPTTDKFYRYRILFTSLDGTHYIPATTSTSTNATSARTVNQRVIDPFGRIVYYNSTTAINAEAMPGATTLRDQSTVTLGYSFNRTGAALTLTQWKPVYLKCAPQTTEGVIIDADTPYVQDLPTTEDGKIYIFLGVAYSATAVEMLVNHPIYWYKNGAIRIWTGAEQRIAALEQRIAALETILNNNS